MPKETITSARVNCSGSGDWGIVIIMKMFLSIATVTNYNIIVYSVVFCARLSKFIHIRSNSV